MIEIVALHGFTGAPGDWRPVVEHLDGVVCQEIPIVGHHPSVLDVEVESFDDEVERLLGAVANLGVTRPWLIGYSLGARLALAMALRAGEPFAGVMLVGVRPGLDAEQRDARRLADDRLAERLENDGIEPFVDHWETLPLFATQRRLPAATLAAQRQRRLVHDPHGLAHALRVLSPGRMDDYRSRLANLTVPVHLVVGAEDLAFRDLANEMLTYLPDGRLHSIDATGHNPILERPAAVAAFMQKEIIHE
ncbi:MAG: alpha/beta fold hydrolase [Acidobacteriota bacterium]